MSVLDPRNDEEIQHDIEEGQVYRDSRSDELLELIYIDGNVYVFQRPDETHRFGSRKEFEDNVIAGRFSLDDGEESFAVTEVSSENAERDVSFEELEGIGEKAAQNLRSEGYRTYGDIARAPDDKLLDVSWVGEKGLHSLREAVNQLEPQERWSDEE